MASWKSINIILLHTVAILLNCVRIGAQTSVFDADVIHDSEAKLRQDLSRGYKIEVLPPHNKTSPVKVQLELSILAIRDLDFKQQILTTDCWIKTIWSDSRLKWDKAFYSNIELFRTDIKKIWQPDIKLYNNVHGNLDASTGEVYALVYNDGKVFYVPPVTYKTFCEMDIRFYPYDQHECIFKFGSWTYDGFHIQVELIENVTEIEHSYAWSNGGEWEIVSSRAEALQTIYPCCEEPYPDATFYVTLRRRSPFFKAAVLSPVVAVVGLLLSAFWISPVASGRIVVSCVALILSVATLLSLRATLPPTGVLAPLVVTFTSSLTILSMIVTITSVVFANICSTRQHDILPHWIDVILRTRIVSTIFCITPPESFERFANQNDSETGNSDDSKQSRGGAGINFQQGSRWIVVFQLIDRIAFVVCSIILIATLISLSV